MLNFAYINPLFAQQAGVGNKLMLFKEDVKKLSPETEVIIPKHLGTIK